MASFVPADWLEPKSSFNAPLSDPGTNPTEAPYICIPVNVAWQEIVAGCLVQLTQAGVWDVSPHSALEDVLWRSAELVRWAAVADYCMQSGTVSLTILAGNATVGATVTFPFAFASTADVVVSESTGIYIASSDTPTSSGVHVAITSSTPLDSDSSATLTWLARAHT